MNLYYIKFQATFQKHFVGKLNPNEPIFADYLILIYHQTVCYFTIIH